MQTLEIPQGDDFISYLVKLKEEQQSRSLDLSWLRQSVARLAVTPMEIGENNLIISPPPAIQSIFNPNLATGLAIHNDEVAVLSPPFIIADSKWNGPITISASLPTTTEKFIKDLNTPLYSCLLGYVGDVSKRIQALRSIKNLKL